MLAASSSMPALFCVLRTFPSQAVSLLSVIFTMSVMVFSLVCVTLSGDASDGPEAGAASHRKIGGNLQGEPMIPVDATSACGGQGARMPKGCVQTLSREKQLTTLKRSDRERKQISNEA